MARKVGEYLEAGVRLVWLVDPALRCITVYCPNAEPTVLREGQTVGAEPVLPGFAVAVSEIFAKVRR